jgi:hypothetical protein
VSGVGLASESIRSPRLDLVLLSLPIMDAIVAGDRRGAQALAGFAVADELFSGEPEDAAYFSMRRDQLLRDASWAPWSQRAIDSREDNAMIGWAHREHGVDLFVSGVAPENLPSLQVNEKLGFVPSGRIVDGELIFELRVTCPTGPVLGTET